MAFTEEEESALRGMLAVFRAESAALSDDAALMCPDVYPEWSGEGLPYAVGERLRFDGTLYQVLQDHASQADWTPKAAPSLFAAVLVDGEGQVVEWVAPPPGSNGYVKGQKVTHGGKTWESLVDNNVWEPGVSGTETVWAEV